MSNPEEEEGQVSKQKKIQDDKKRSVSYLKGLVEELDRSMAKNFAKGLYGLAAHDAKRMASLLEVLSEIDVAQ